jgi:prefoldin subunit 5
VASYNSIFSSLGTTEDAIEKLSQYVESCTPRIGRKAKVDADDITHYISDIRAHYQQEVKEAAEVKRRRDEIIAAAESLAARIERDARNVADQLVASDEIFRRVHEKCRIEKDSVEEFFINARAQAIQAAYNAINEAETEIRTTLTNFREMAGDLETGLIDELNALRDTKKHFDDSENYVWEGEDEEED